MSEKKIAVFDIDGTIFRKNLHFELINELVWMKVFPSEARSTLTEVYSSWLQHEGTYEEYRQALVALYAKHIKGCDAQAVIRASQTLIPFHAKRTYIYAENLIQKLRTEHFHIIAVSGSPAEVVEEYNNHYLKFDAVFGSVYARDNADRYTGEAEFEPSRDKGEVVRRYIAKNNLTLHGSYGVGDTESDISFLRLVDYPIAFNPNQNLKSTADEAGWKIVVEKKDVIYEVLNHNQIKTL
ncbi:MAG: HAD family hydrolase [Minisyncoccota bacterium]